MKRKDLIVENQVSRKILGLLFKREMSVSDLARELYENINVRSGITKRVDELLRTGFIQRTDLNKITGKKRLYESNFDVIGKFTKEEMIFIRLVVDRFWNPIRQDPIGSLRDFLLELIIIKKVSKIKNNLLGYNPIKDLERYKKNKGKFWEDKMFRDLFLNKLAREGSEKYEKALFKKKKIPSVHIRRDFIFMSLLIPNTIFNKLSGKHKDIGDPLFVAVILLDN